MISNEEYIELLLAEKDVLDTSRSIHSVRLLDKEIERVRSGKPKQSRSRSPTPDYDEEYVTVTETIFLPVQQFPDLDLIETLLGKDGENLEGIQTSTNSHIMLRGKGSMRDEQKEKRLLEIGEEKYDHLKEPLHLLVETEGVKSVAHGLMADVLTVLRRCYKHAKKKKIGDERLLRTNRDSTRLTKVVDKENKDRRHRSADKVDSKKSISLKDKYKEKNSSGSHSKRDLDNRSDRKTRHSERIKGKETLHCKNENKSKEELKQGEKLKREKELAEEKRRNRSTRYSRRSRRYDKHIKERLDDKFATIDSLEFSDEDEQSDGSSSSEHVESDNEFEETSNVDRGFVNLVDYDSPIESTVEISDDESGTKSTQSIKSSRANSEDGSYQDKDDAKGEEVESDKDNDNSYPSSDVEMIGEKEETVSFVLNEGKVKKETDSDELLTEEKNHSGIKLGYKDGEKAEKDHEGTNENEGENVREAEEEKNVDDEEIDENDEEVDRIDEEEDNEGEREEDEDEENGSEDENEIEVDEIEAKVDENKAKVKENETEMDEVESEVDGNEAEFDDNEADVNEDESEVDENDAEAEDVEVAEENEGNKEGYETDGDKNEVNANEGDNKLDSECDEDKGKEESEEEGSEAGGEESDAEEEKRSEAEEENQTQEEQGFVNDHTKSDLLEEKSRDEKEAEIELCKNEDSVSGKHKVLDKDKEKKISKKIEKKVHEKLKIEEALESKEVSKRGKGSVAQHDRNEKNEAKKSEDRVKVKSSLDSGENDRKKSDRKISDQDIGNSKRDEKSKYNDKKHKKSGPNNSHSSSNNNDRSQNERRSYVRDRIGHRGEGTTKDSQRSNVKKRLGSCIGNVKFGKESESRRIEVKQDDIRIEIRQDNAQDSGDRRRIEVKTSPDRHNMSTSDLRYKILGNMREVVTLENKLKTITTKFSHDELSQFSTSSKIIDGHEDLMLEKRDEYSRIDKTSQISRSNLSLDKYLEDDQFRGYKDIRDTDYNQVNEYSWRDERNDYRSSRNQEPGLIDFGNTTTRDDLDKELLIEDNRNRERRHDSQIGDNNSKTWDRRDYDRENPLEASNIHYDRDSGKYDNQEIRNSRDDRYDNRENTWDEARDGNYLFNSREEKYVSKGDDRYNDRGNDRHERKDDKHSYGDDRNVNRDYNKHDNQGDGWRYKNKGNEGDGSYNDRNYHHDKREDGGYENSDRKHDDSHGGFVDRDNRYENRGNTYEDRGNIDDRREDGRNLDRRDSRDYEHDRNDSREVRHESRGEDRNKREDYVDHSRRDYRQESGTRDYIDNRSDVRDNYQDAVSKDHNSGDRYGGGRRDNRNRDQQDHRQDDRLYNRGDEWENKRDTSRERGNTRNYSHNERDGGKTYEGRNMQYVDRSDGQRDSRDEEFRDSRNNKYSSDRKYHEDKRGDQGEQNYGRGDSSSAHNRNERTSGYLESKYRDKDRYNDLRSSTDNNDNRPRGYRDNRNKDNKSDWKTNDPRHDKHNYDDRINRDYDNRNDNRSKNNNSLQNDRKMAHQDERYSDSYSKDYLSNTGKRTDNKGSTSSYKDGYSRNMNQDSKPKNPQKENFIDSSLILQPAPLPPGDFDENGLLRFISDMIITEAAAQVMNPNTSDNKSISSNKSAMSKSTNKGIDGFFGLSSVDELVDSSNSLDRLNKDSYIRNSQSAERSGSYSKSSSKHEFFSDSHKRSNGDDAYSSTTFHRSNSSKNDSNNSRNNNSSKNDRYNDVDERRNNYSSNRGSVKRQNQSDHQLSKRQRTDQGTDRHTSSSRTQRNNYNDNYNDRSSRY